MVCETWQTLLLGFRALALPASGTALTSPAGSLFEAIKEFFVRYTEFVWSVVSPLGSWAVFAIAGIDSAFWGFPLDPLVAGYVYRDPHRFLLYAGMAAAGSAAGSVVLYVIGYKGGEVLLLQRMPAQKFDRIRNSFDHHEFWALMFPSMMPPPFPFKLFVLAASVFEMNFWHFLLAIFAGRLVRFVVLSILVLKFGARVLGFIFALLQSHAISLVLVALAALAAALLIWLFLRRRPAASGPHETSPKS